jgi:hypothetical protein
MHRHLTISSSDIRFPNDQRISDTGEMNSPDGITQGFYAIQPDAHNHLMINHGINGISAGAMINDETQFDGVRFWHRMNRNGIHARKKDRTKRLRKPPGPDFNVTLGGEELTFVIVFWGVLREFVRNWIIVLRLSPRPKTFAKASKDRLHEGLVGMVHKETGKDIDFDIASNVEELRMIADSISSNSIGELRLRRTWQRVSEKRILGSRTGGMMDQRCESSRENHVQNEGRDTMGQTQSFFAQSNFGCLPPQEEQTCL